MSIRLSITATTIGNDKNNSWHSLKSPKVFPDATDAMVDIAVRGVEPEQLEAALAAMRQAGKVTRTVASTLGLWCQIVCANYDVGALRGLEVENDFSNRILEELRKGLENSH